jgi:hypothetical protein
VVRLKVTSAAGLAAPRNYRAAVAAAAA